jgi:acylglycerol lipase
MPSGPAVERRHGEGIFQGAGGLKLYYRRWLPEVWPPRAILAIVHGPGIDSALYTSAVNHLGPHGYAVYGFQHREHVRSPGQRGFVIEWGQSRGDVVSFLQMITEQVEALKPDLGVLVREQDHEERAGPEPDMPLFLLGSGLGGSIVMTYALHHSEGLTGVVALNPASAPREGQSLLVRLSRSLSHMWPRFSAAAPIDYSTVPAELHPEQATSAPTYSAPETLGFSAESPVADTQIEVQTGDLPVPHLILRGGTTLPAAPGGAPSFTQKPAEYSRTQHSLPADGDNDPLLVELERWLEDHL